MEFKENIGIIIPSFEPDEKLLMLLKNLNNSKFRKIIVVDNVNGLLYSISKSDGKLCFTRVDKE